MIVSRRKFLALAGASAAGVSVLSPLEAYFARAAHGQSLGVANPPKLVPTLPANGAQLTNTILGDLSQEAILSLPPGFKYNVLSMTGMPMADGTLVPAGHDGMAAFRGPNGTTVLVRNHELSILPANYNYPVAITANAPKYDPEVFGGTTTLVVDRNGNLVKDFVSLAGTKVNCAGGPTPWGSWITCEETFSVGSASGIVSTTSTAKHGYNFEVIADPNSGVVTPVPLTAMGRFSHEAIAVDPRTSYIYETEDRGDSCFYRFIPTVVEEAQARRSDRKPQLGDLAKGGKLFALRILNGPQNTTNNPTQGGVAGQIKVGTTFNVDWVPVDNADPIAERRTVVAGVPTPANEVAVRYQVQAKGAAIFYRGEGAWYGNGLVYFVSTQAGTPAVGATNGRGNGQVWAYDPKQETLTLVVEASATGDLLDEPDNITVTPWGHLFLCEDSSDDFQYVVGVNKQGQLYQFIQNTLFSKVASDPAKAPFVGNEFAGACFSPDGKIFFVNIQTPGITFAITGPWDRVKSL